MPVQNEYTSGIFKIQMIFFLSFEKRRVYFGYGREPDKCHYEFSVCVKLLGETT